MHAARGNIYHFSSCSGESGALTVDWCYLVAASVDRVCCILRILPFLALLAQLSDSSNAGLLVKIAAILRHILQALGRAIGPVSGMACFHDTIASSDSTAHWVCLLIVVIALHRDVGQTGITLARADKPGIALVVRADYLRGLSVRNLLDIEGHVVAQGRRPGYHLLLLPVNFRWDVPSLALVKLVHLSRQHGARSFLHHPGQGLVERASLLVQIFSLSLVRVLVRWVIEGLHHISERVLLLNRYLSSSVAVKQTRVDGGRVVAIRVLASRLIERVP